MKQILISQHYSRNKGNVSLLFTLYSALKENIPAAKIIVGSFDPSETKDLFGYDCCEWPFVTRNVIDAKGLFRLWHCISESFFIFLNILVATLVRFHLFPVSWLKGRLKPLKVICDSSVLISPGGHLFTNLNPFIGIFAHFFPCFLAYLVKTPYVIIAQTIGPFHGGFKIPSVMITRFLVKHANYISVRDNSSYQNMSNNKISTSNVKKTNELVFLFPEQKKEPQTHAKPVWGITFHHIYYKHWMTKADYIKRMTEFIRKSGLKHDLSIRFISMEKSYDNRGDVPMLKEIRDLLSDDINDIEIVYSEMDPAKILDAFRGIDFLTATKTHSVVYGLRLAIPTLAIAYDPKTTDFMTDFDMAKFSVPLETFDSNQAAVLFDEIISGSELIVNKLKDKLQYVQKESMKNINAIKAIIDDNR